MVVSYYNFRSANPSGAKRGDLSSDAPLSAYNRDVSDYDPRVLVRFRYPRQDLVCFGPQKIAHKHRFRSMITIEPNQVTTAVMALFDIDKPTMPRAFNVLEGLNRGQILVDDTARPSRALIRDVVYGTLYLGGQVDAAWLAALVQHFRQEGEVGIGCWLDDPLNEMLPPAPDYDGRTLYFTERTPSHDGRKAELLTEFRMLLRDEHTFPRSFDYASTLDAFGSIQNVLQHTLGVVILDEETLVCEAATGAPTHGRIEVGVTTAEAYRERGLATLACQRLIELCEARGYTTWWDCAKQNTPSVRLARRLGYQNEREYRYVWWRKQD